MKKFSEVLSEHAINLAPKMSVQSINNYEDPQYDIMSDAIYWKDEIPQHLEPKDIDVLRFILRYRTMSICGEEFEEFSNLWNASQKAFPTWVGFSPERCLPSAYLCDYYRQKSQIANQELDNLQNSIFPEDQ